MPSLRSSLRYAVTLLAVAAAIAASVYVWRSYTETPWTRDGRVRARIVQMVVDVSGAVSDLRIRDNQTVHKGDVLFVIDQTRYRLALDRAKAIEAERRAEVEQRRREAERRERLTSAAVSEETREQAQTALASAEGALQQAIAEREVAELDLDRTTVRSPVNGYVTNLLLDPGDYVTAGNRVVALVDSDSFFVAGYFEETKLFAIHPGDPATIRLMGRSGELRGRVESIARAVVDRENTTSNDLIADVNPSFSWVRLAQRVPVRISIVDPPADLQLSSGLTATVVVHSERR